MRTLFIAASITLATLSVKAQTSKVVVADDCETTQSWSSAQPITLDNADFKEGKGALKTEGIGPFRFRKAFSTPVNTGLEGKAGYISFWLYVSDVSDIATTPGLLAISSSGKMELNAHHFNFKNLNLKNGWNKMVFQLTDASAKGGAFDDTKMNYFMLFQKTTASTVFKLDHIRFAKDLKDI
jgi:hypothetical protein